MRLMTTIAALTLAALPVFAQAECGSQHIKDSATSCPTGTTLDATTGSCVKQVSS